MFRQAQKKWKQEGDLNVALPKEMNAECDYYVRYSCGHHTVSLLRRDARGKRSACMKITYTGLTQHEINAATELTIFNKAAKRDVRIPVNEYHSRGQGTPADGITTCYLDLDSWKDLNHLSVVISFIGNHTKDKQLQNKLLAHLLPETKTNIFSRRK